MKRFFVCLFYSLLLCNFINAEKYKISEVLYNIDGKTKETNLEHKIKINKKRVFNNQDELAVYISDIKKQFENLRVFDSVSIQYSINNNSENDIKTVNVSIDVSDSKNFIILPYIKYDSNDGSVIKAKIRDSNFLGTLNEASGDVYFCIDPKNDGNVDFGLGASFKYDYPFYFGPFECSWNNDYDCKYTFGEELPEWTVNSGLTFAIPFDQLSLKLTLTQKIVNDFDYNVFNDALYFGEVADFSVPIILQNIPRWGDIIYTPSVNFTYNWSFHKINSRNDDLLSPELLFSNKISTSSINWNGNFRSGLSFYARQDSGYNYLINDMVIGFESELQFFLDWKYAGMNTRLYGFSYINKNKKTCSRIRGIRDDEYFANSSLSDINSTSTPRAIILNLDFPIHIFTMTFDNWNWDLIKKLGFELQISPFVDFSLTKNRVTGRSFDIKDSFICAGVEFIVYPLKFKSLQVRASAGFDIGRLLLKNYIDTSWRPNVSPYELSIGFGLHY